MTEGGASPIPLRVFLSYARKDAEQADAISGELTAGGAVVWRDQDALRAGQNWPKALGEAIAASDALFLLWSSHAGESEFVELEWCTALALKKTVVPCLLDDTAVPRSLVSIEATGPAGIGEAARKLFAARSNETKSADPSHTSKVVQQLGKIEAAAPAEVLQKAKAVFAESHWMVEGPVYQASGDIHIGSPPAQKTWLEKWQSWVAILAGIVVIAGGVRSWIASPKEQETSQPPGAVTATQILAGSIWDHQGEPIGGVEVSVVLGGKTVASTTTDGLGQFRFRVDGAPEAEVTLIAKKERYQTKKRYTHLGNPGFNFKLERTLK